VLSSILKPWFFAWLLSTLLWGASARLGLWMVNTAWLLIVIGLWGAVIVALAGNRSFPKIWTLKGVGYGLLASAGGPLTVFILQAIGRRL
jgi:hypothetical protein